MALTRHSYITPTDGYPACDSCGHSKLSAVHGYVDQDMIHASQESIDDTEE